MPSDASEDFPERESRAEVQNGLPLDFPDRFFCVRCSREVEAPCDHRKPRSQGGSDSDGNVQPLCPACHRWKHGHPLEANAAGFTLLRAETERDYWIDFPHARVRYRTGFPYRTFA